MENDKSEPQAPQSPSQPVAPVRKPGSRNAKWYAVIVVLIMIIAAVAVLAYYHPAGSSAKVTSASTSATLGQPYNLTVQANGVFQSLTVHWGDHSTSTMTYSGSNKVTLQHTYDNPGTYYVYYTMNFGGSTYSSANQLVPVTITAPLSALVPTESFGLAQLQAASAHPLVNLTNLYKPGTSLHYILGYFSAPSNSSYAVIGQTLTVYQNGTAVNSTVLPYYYNFSAGQYELSAVDSYFNTSGLSAGYYEMALTTTTAAPMVTSGIPSVVENTTVASYTKNDVVTYSNTSELHYGTNATYSSTPPELTYLNTTEVTNMAQTNITYVSAANVTYASSTEVSLPVFTAFTLDMGANLTTTGYANVSFLNNGTVKTNDKAFSSGKFNNKTSSVYMIKPGEWVNFTSPADMQVVNQSTGNSLMFGPQSTVVYQGGMKLDVLTTGNAMYNTVSTLMYTDPSTTVTYVDATNVTIVLFVTGTQQPTTVGEIDTSAGVFTTTYYVDLYVASSANVYVAPVSGETFTNAEIAPGGYTTLDPQIAFYTTDEEILQNTMLTLVGFNGSSASSFVPLAASQVPTTANGGINTNYANYTVKDPWGTSYVVHIKPGENYTFHMRANATWQNGQPVTAYDAYYGLVRDLLFADGSPGTGGYLLGDYVLPDGNLGANTYWNITQNITYNNKTQNVTVHTQGVIPSSLFFQLIAGPETSPIDVTWLAAHGDAIQFTPSGFANYSATGNSADYNTYVQNNIMADGPYMVSYNLPASEMVLVKNPAYNEPGKWFPSATISTVYLQYVSSPSTAYLEFESGAAQSVIGLPTTPYWPEIQALNASGKVKIYPYNTIGIYFYNFNTRINTTYLSSIVSNANVPSTLFVNPNVRKAFAYAYNYSKYFNQQQGNAIYHTTFENPYVGLLPPGMLFNQSIAQVEAHGVQVVDYNGTAYAQYSNASHYWDNFVNNNSSSDGFKAMGLSFVKGVVEYGGKALVIPIFVPTGDTTDIDGATTWANELAKLIPGASFPVETTSYTNLYAGYAVQPAAPMPISWGGWSPDYVYPSDYFTGMGLPFNQSTYMSSSYWNPFWISGGNASIHNPTPNATEAAMMESMLENYHNASANASNPANAEYWFHQLNYQVINSSMEVYIGQAVLHDVYPSDINGNDVVKYQQNLMIGAGNELLYNLMAYT